MNPRETEKGNLLRSIPQVNDLAELAIKRYPEIPGQVLMAAVKVVIDRSREAILSSSPAFNSEEDLAPEALLPSIERESASMLKPRFRKVINATGVVLHTNLGRAPLSRKAVEAVRETAEGYCNLEYDLENGTRGSRQDHLEPIFSELTGAEAAMVVNNNAAAVLLALTALARGREVIVSRGQLVEIGDSFRLPDIMRQSGATLVEVGTTNITRISDYRDAIGPDTALMMRIHPSNFTIVGYTEQVSMSELSALGRAHAVPVAEDLGSGSLVELGPAGLEGEHTARNSIEAGADLVTFSGDKLLGGPQAGIVVGGSSYVEALRAHPLARAVRVDKMTVAALEATALAYLDTRSAMQEVPALRMLTEEPEVVKARAVRLKRMLDRSAPAALEYTVVRDSSRAGGGSLPTIQIPSFCLRINHRSESAAAIEESLRKGEPAVLGRVKEDALFLDLRTVTDAEIPILGRILTSLA